MTFDELTSPAAISSRCRRLLELCWRIDGIARERPTRQFVTELERIEWLEDRLASYESLAAIIHREADTLAAVTGFAARDQVLGDRPSRVHSTPFRELLERIEAEDAA